MEVSIDRLVAIISCMYERNAELVIDQVIEECYLYFGGIRQSDLKVSYEEVDRLVFSNVIEFDSGCSEEGYETKVFRLTEIAQIRIQEIIRDKKIRQLKLEK